MPEIIFRLNRTFLILTIIFDHEQFSIRYKGACLWNSLNITISSLMNLNTFYNDNNCLCGSVAKASDTQAVGHGFDPSPDH